MLTFTCDVVLFGFTVRETTVSAGGVESVFVTDGVRFVLLLCKRCAVRLPGYKQL